MNDGKFQIIFYLTVVIVLISVCLLQESLGSHLPLIINLIRKLISQLKIKKIIVDLVSPHLSLNRIISVFLLQTVIVLIRDARLVKFAG